MIRGFDSKTLFQENKPSKHALCTSMVVFLYKPIQNSDKVSPSGICPKFPDAGHVTYSQFETFNDYSLGATYRVLLSATILLAYHPCLETL